MSIIAQRDPKKSLATVVNSFMAGTAKNNSSSAVKEHGSGESTTSSLLAASPGPKSQKVCGSTGESDVDADFTGSSNEGGGEPLAFSPKRERSACSPKLRHAAAELGTRVPLIDSDEIRQDELKFIGSGAFGTVYRGYWQDRMVAFKVLNLPSDQLDKEASHLCRLSHRNVVQFFGVCALGGLHDSLALVMEFAHGGPLSRVLIDHPHIGPQILLQWAVQIATGMDYLHADARLVHRDLKSANILIREPLDRPFVDSQLHMATLVITDFGMACRCSEVISQQSKLGTVAYAAPEVCRQATFSFKSDVWSFGVVLWELLMLETPYRNMEQPRLLFLIAMRFQTLYIPEDIPELFRQLLIDCWSVNPESRPNFAEIIARLECTTVCDFLTISPDELSVIQSQWREAVGEQQRLYELAANNNTLSSSTTDMSQSTASVARTEITDLMDEKARLQHGWDSLNWYCEQLSAREQEIDQKEENYTRMMGSMGHQFTVLAVLAANQLKHLPPAPVPWPKPKPTVTRKRPFVRNLFRRGNHADSPTSCSTETPTKTTTTTTTRNRLTRAKSHRKVVANSDARPPNAMQSTVSTPSDVFGPTGLGGATTATSTGAGWPGSVANRLGCSRGGIPHISPPVNMKHVVHVDHDWMTRLNALIDPSSTAASSPGSLTSMTHRHDHAPPNIQAAFTDTGFYLGQGSSERVTASTPPFRQPSPYPSDPVEDPMPNVEFTLDPRTNSPIGTNYKSIDVLHHTSNHSIDRSNFYTSSPVEWTTRSRTPVTTTTTTTTPQRRTVVSPSVQLPSGYASRQCSGDKLSDVGSGSDQSIAADQNVTDRRRASSGPIASDRSAVHWPAPTSTEMKTKPTGETVHTASHFKAPNCSDTAYPLLAQCLNTPPPSKTSCIDTALLQALRLAVSLSCLPSHQTTNATSVNSATQPSVTTHPTSRDGSHDPDTPLLGLYSSSLMHRPTPCTDSGEVATNILSRDYRKPTATRLYGPRRGAAVANAWSNGDGRRRIQSVDRYEDDEGLGSGLGSNEVFLCARCRAVSVSPEVTDERIRMAHRAEFGDPHSPFLGTLAGSGRRPVPNLAHFQQQQTQHPDNRPVPGTNDLPCFVCTSSSTHRPQYGSTVHPPSYASSTTLFSLHQSLFASSGDEQLPPPASPIPLAYTNPSDTSQLPYPRTQSTRAIADYASRFRFDRLRATLPGGQQEPEEQLMMEDGIPVYASTSTVFSARPRLQDVGSHGALDTTSMFTARAESDPSFVFPSYNPVAHSRDAYLKVTQDGYLNRTVQLPPSPINNHNNRFARVQTDRYQWDRASPPSDAEGDVDDEELVLRAAECLEPPSERCHQQHPEQADWSDSSSDSSDGSGNSSDSVAGEFHRHGRKRLDEDRITLVPTYGLNGVSSGESHQQSTDSPPLNDQCVESLDANASLPPAPRLPRRSLQRSPAMRSNRRPEMLLRFGRNRSVPESFDRPITDILLPATSMTPDNPSSSTVFMRPPRSVSPCGPYVSLHSTLL